MPFFKKRRWKVLTAFIAGILTLWLFCLPTTLFDAPLATVLLDRDGQLLSASIAEDEQWRIPAADSLSPKLAKAIMAFEDKRFEDHWGVDLIALGRAMRQNWRAGSIVSGGSTITMQVIRLSRDNPPRTVLQKVIEAFLATRLEWRYNKEEILKLWCDNAPFGGNVVGIEAAAWRYYGRSATDLSWAEAATLAVLPNSPALIHPGRSRDQLLAKRDRLLDKLLANGSITDEEYELSRLESLPQKPLRLPRFAPHLMTRLKLSGRSGRINTCLDGNLQRRITSSVERHRDELARSEIHNAAALVIEVSSGAVVAYVGNSGNDPDHDPEVDMVTAPRSPGSLLKPVLYGLALSNGTLAPRELLPDYPSSFRGFRPANFNAGYSGAVAADRALARSLNIPFVYLLREFGIPNFHAELQDFGFDFLDQPAGHYGLSLVLGGCEINMEQIASWFLGLSRQQRYYYNRQGLYDSHDWDKALLLRPTDSQAGQVCQPKETNQEKLVRRAGPIDAGAGYLTLQSLRQLERPGQEGEWEQFATQRKIGWKTGTSFGFRDAWAVGTDPNYVVAVWTGNADGEGRKGLVGIKAAAPLFFDIFHQLPDDGPEWFEPPYDELRQITTCTLSGLLAGPSCPLDSSWVAINTERADVCKYHQRIWVDEAEERRVSIDCPVENQRQVSWFSLPPRLAHYYRKENPGYRSLPEWHSACEGPEVTNERTMQLIYPHNSGVISLSMDENGLPIPVIFQLAHQQPATEVYWHLNGEFIGTTAYFHTKEIVTSPGRHHLVLTDENGSSLHHYFEISE
ncbi:penicillin-binding protein 1C [Lewinellaceae bacterium SD302]|nr:penicillin-binding protein 1C [Lewinellaceae bacterium SD302]